MESISSARDGELLIGKWRRGECVEDEGGIKNRVCDQK